jgi:flagellar P-ring protein precursor FlgI
MKRPAIEKKPQARMPAPLGRDLKWGRHPCLPHFATTWICLFGVLALAATNLAAADKLESRLKDIATIEGVRDNPLVGYGIVVGLKGTGDSQQTVFSMQTLANIMQRMGLQVSATAIRANNVAAVFVTGTLPPFAHPGTRIDVTVSSTGDAKGLGGGILLLTSLTGGDGQVYAVAQGALTLGGYSAGGAGNAKDVNHPTVARVPSGAIVERETSLDLTKLRRVALELRDPDFSTARDIAAVINKEFEREVAHVVDSREVEISRPATGEMAIPALLARIENLTVAVQSRARVIVNERTGTVVMGKDVRISGVSIMHGSLSIEVSTEFTVSQPLPNSKGTTEVVPQTTLKTKENPVKRLDLQGGATVDDFVRGLQSIGASARDIVAILQAIKEAGGLQAELVII